jgi:hypothetical protein
MSNSHALMRSRIKDPINYLEESKNKSSADRKLLWRDRSLDNFESLRLKQLSERLDRQIEYSKARIDLMQFWK